jgi:hypothetical protein
LPDTKYTVENFKSAGKDGKNSRGRWKKGDSEGGLKEDQVEESDSIYRKNITTI